MSEKICRRFIEATRASVRMDGDATKKIEGYASVFYNGSMTFTAMATYSSASCRVHSTARSARTT